MAHIEWNTEVAGCFLWVIAGVASGCQHDPIATEDGTTSDAQTGLEEAHGPQDVTSAGSDTGDGPADPIGTEAHCPAPGAVQVGIDALIRVDYPYGTAIAQVPDSGLLLSCNGIAVLGTTTFAGASLTFEPQESLPPRATCNVELPAGGVAADGSALAPAAWEFATGNAPAPSFAFGEPQNVSQDLGLNQVLAAEGNIVVIAWSRGPDLILAVSDDAGETFTILDPLVTLDGAGAIDGTEVRVIDGVIHATWRVLPDSEGEIFYTRSLDGVFDLAEVQFISTPYDGFTTYNPSVVSNGAELVYITYSEGPAGRSGDTVLIVTSNDGGATFGPPSVVDSNVLSDQKVAWVDGGPLLLWTRDGAIVLADAAQGFEPYASIPAFTDYPWLLTPRRMPDGSALILWLGNGYHHAALASTRDATGISDSHAVAENDQNTYSSVALRHDGSLIRVASTLELGSGNDSEVHRELSVAPGWQEPFGVAQSLDFFLPLGWPRPSDGPTDDQFVIVEGGPEDTAYLSWVRNFPDEQWPPQIMFSRGARVPPCSAGPS